MTGDGHGADFPGPSGGPDTTGLLVEGYDETPDGAGDLTRWCEVARSTLEGEGVGRGQLDLIFVDPEAMAELNREHMGEDRPTDVLAFPLDGPEVLAEPLAPPAGPHEPPPHLGDVVVCPDVARRQATDHTGTVDAEFTLLVVHGVLHVLGHDHAEEAERRAMQARERHHLARYGFAHPVAAS